MINMKIENVDNKIIVYLFNEFFDTNDISELNKKIKDIFLKIMKRSNYDFFGYNLVSVYQNKYYGTILEVEKISNNDYYRTIDLKIRIFKDIVMYLEFDDYYFSSKPKNLIINNGKYYLEINKYIDINRYIEFGKINYKKLLNEID